MVETRFNSFEEAGIDIDPEVFEKLLRLGCNGPLKNVEDVIFPEPWDPSLLHHHSQYMKGKRGPKPLEDWIREIRKIWDYLEDIYELGSSWLARLPQVQELATSKYGGGLVGRGSALKEFFTKALIEARQYKTDERSHAMLSKYPEMTITEIASECGITREQFSRQYCPKAVIILTECFQKIIGRKSKSRTHKKSA